MTRSIVKENLPVTRIKGKLGGSAFLLFLCFSMVLGSSAGAATADEKLVSKFVGKDWVNGRSWEKLDYAGKLGFVCGLFDGITLFWSAATTGKKVDLDNVYHSLSTPGSLTVGDIVKGIDEFYDDTANLRLPAVCAYLFFASKSRGDSAESLNKRLILWRKMFNQ
ncbi:MAG TPA: hypothetical protein PKV86_09135 [Syntrophobacteraceae bacterium]|nr:hypothetical protein [Syntrophobacteraceae bacterium]